MNKDAQTLKKAIEKAQTNGMPKVFSEDEDDGQRLGDCKVWLSDDSYMAIIFRHDFAKGFWRGEVMYCGDCLTVIKEWSDKCEIPDCPRETLHKEEAWQYHLQQLALAEDRIGYLAKHL